MKAFILAAGLGTRLLPVTSHCPKPLVPVWNVPAIMYALALVRQCGIREVICNLHYLPGVIEAFFADHDSFGMDVRFSHEKEILGTGGGIMKCRDLLGDDEFLILNCDVLMDLDVASLLKRHREAGSPATIVLYPTPEAEQIGPVALSGDRVADFKHVLGSGIRSRHIYTGAAVLGPSIFPYLENGFSSVVYTGYTGLVQNESLSFYEHKGIWADIGNLSDLWSLNVKHREWGEHFRDALHSLDDTNIAAVSREAAVGRDCVIDNSVIGDGALIGDGAHVRDSLVLPGGRVPPGARIAESIVYGGETIPCRNLERTIN